MAVPTVYAMYESKRARLGVPIDREDGIAWALSAAFLRHFAQLRIVFTRIDNYGDDQVLSAGSLTIPERHSHNTNEALHRQ